MLAIPRQGTSGYRSASSSGMCRLAPDTISIARSTASRMPPPSARGSRTLPRHGELGVGLLCGGYGTDELQQAGAELTVAR
mgnify:CR=1 FL=1